MFPPQDPNCLRKPRATYHLPDELLMLLLAADLMLKPHRHLVTKAPAEERHPVDGGLATIPLATAPRQVIISLLGSQTPCVVDQRVAV